MSGCISLAYRALTQKGLKLKIAKNFSRFTTPNLESILIRNSPTPEMSTTGSIEITSKIVVQVSLTVLESRYKANFTLI